MISQSAEYALRAVVHLAGQGDKALTTQEIAQATQVPAGYLAKIMQALVRARIVLSHRGLGGGFALTREPADLTLLEIVQAVDPSRRIRTCPLGLASHGANLCPLHRRIDQAVAAVERSLAATTVAEVLAESSTCDCQGEENGVRNRLPERPEGCCAQTVPDTVFLPASSNGEHHD